MTATRLNPERPQMKTATLLAWGNYTSVGTSYKLNDDIRNYKAIIFRTGFDTSQTTGGGSHYDYVLTYFLTLPEQIECSYVNGNGTVYGTVQITDWTHVKILGANNGWTLRWVLGIY